MTMKLYVGNLAFQTSSDDLQELFSQAGTVESASVVEDRAPGPTCFASVEMSLRKRPILLNSSMARIHAAICLMRQPAKIAAVEVVAAVGRLWRGGGRVGVAAVAVWLWWQSRGWSRRRWRYLGSGGGDASRLVIVVFPHTMSL